MFPCDSKCEHKMRLLAICLFLGVTSAYTGDEQWPLPYANYTKRPERDQRCQLSPQQRFCPKEVNILKLDFDPNDVIDIYVRTKQVSDFDRTPMDSYKMISVGLILHSRMTSKNFSISYSPFSSVLDALVPLIFPNKELVWCNQGAVCVSPTEETSGNLGQKIGLIGGDRIDSLLTWLMYFNNTKPFFEPLSINGNSKEELYPDAAQTWMLQMDGTRFVMEAISLLNHSGAEFFGNSTLHFSSFSVFCSAPELLGPPKQVQQKNPKLFEEITDFFEKLQPSTNILTRLYHRLMFDWYVNVEGKFFYLFNEQLWKLNLVPPKITMESLQLNI